MNKIAPILFFCCVLISCESGTFKHDPTKPYPLMESGEYWIDKFDQRGLQNAQIHDSMLFVNTIHIGKGENYLYCLSLNNGKVIWRTTIKNYASQPVVIANQGLYFVSFMGDIYRLTMDGKIKWNAKLPASYGGHSVNPINNNLMVRTVTDGFYEYEQKTGKIVNYFAENHKAILPVFESGQMVFSVHNMRRDSPERIIKLDYDSKDTIWHTELKKWKFITGLFKVQDKIVLHNNKDELFCFREKDGVQLWHKSLTERKIGELPKIGMYGHYEGFIYYLLDGELIFLEPSSGEKKELKYEKKIKQYDIQKGDESYRIFVTEKLPGYSEIYRIEINKKI